MYKHKCSCKAQLPCNGVDYFCQDCAQDTKRAVWYDLDISFGCLFHNLGIADIPELSRVRLTDNGLQVRMGCGLGDFDEEFSRIKAAFDQIGAPK
jgi:hypothetical protein